jgi:hypothetical protein
MNCGACDFWWPAAHSKPAVNTYDHGQCRKRSPIILTVVDRDQMSTAKTAYWPNTMADDGCGDYQRHPTRRIQKETV